VAIVVMVMFVVVVMVMVATIPATTVGLPLSVLTMLPFVVLPPVSGWLR
jgi:hypothetical protein